MLELDHVEFGRWLEAFDDEARVARELVAVEAFNAVVLRSDQAAQLLLKGFCVGSEPHVKPGDMDRWSSPNGRLQSPVTNCPTTYRPSSRSRV